MPLLDGWQFCQGADLHRWPFQGDHDATARSRWLGREPGDGVREFCDVGVARLARPHYRSVLDGLRAQGGAADAQTKRRDTR